MAEIRVKMAAKKLACGLQPLLAVDGLVANEGWVAALSRPSAKAGAVGRPLKGLPASHTRPPRSTAGTVRLLSPPFLRGFTPPLTRARLRPEFVGSRLLIEANPRG
jgi:hypothetical protein